MNNGRTVSMAKWSSIREERTVVFTVPKKVRFDKNTVVILDEKMPWVGMPLKRDGVTVGFIQKAVFMGDMIRLTAIVDGSISEEEFDKLRFGI